MTDTQRELLNEVAASSIEWDAGKYVTVQIDKDTWEALQEMRALFDLIGKIQEGGPASVRVTPDALASRMSGSNGEWVVFIDDGAPPIFGEAWGPEEWWAFFARTQESEEATAAFEITKARAVALCEQVARSGQRHGASEEFVAGAYAAAEIVRDMTEGPASP
jgi:hypothetical protein